MSEENGTEQHGSIRPGRYRAQAIKATLAETPNGHPQVVVEFELLDMEGRRVPWYGVITEPSAGKKGTKERVIQSLLFCGWDGEDWTDFNGIDQNTVELDIQPDTYDGKTRMKVKWVNRLGVTVERPMSQEQAMTFAERMRGDVMSVKAKTKLPPPPSGGGELQSDDIPF